MALQSTQVYVLCYKLGKKIILGPLGGIESKNRNEKVAHKVNELLQPARCSDRVGDLGEFTEYVLQLKTWL